MQQIASNPLLPKLLDLSIALFVLVVLCVALGTALWFLWKQNRAEAAAHDVSLEKSNELRLKDSQEYAANRREADAQTRGIVEQLNTVLRNVQGEKSLSSADRKILVAIATKLGCTPTEIN